jgi:DNA modification methylase
MGKAIITEVDGNFGSCAARSILNKINKKDLIFTSPNKAVIEKFIKQGSDDRYADYTNPGQHQGGSIPWRADLLPKEERDKIDWAMWEGGERF